MNVINLDDHRGKPPEPAYDGAHCSCGEAWFEVDGVCITKDGEVTGYAGKPRCKSCGKSYSA
jgi:hypothetical protein